MAAKLFATLAVLSCALHIESKTVIVGRLNDNNNVVSRLVFQKQVDMVGLPLIKRTKEIYFENTPQSLIKVIAIRDLANSTAIAAIDRGGIGFNFVHIKLKSERGAGLKYSVEVYA